MPTVSTSTDHIHIHIPVHPFVVGADHDLSLPYHPPKKNKAASTPRPPRPPRPPPRPRSRGTQTLKIKEVGAKKEKKDKKEKKVHEDCPICLKKMGDKNVVVTKCGHTFCSTCIFTNFGKAKNGHTCPMCRANFAPAFLKSTKVDAGQIATASDWTINTFWRADLKCQKTVASRAARAEHGIDNYENYSMEHGFENVPYFRLVDHIRHVLRKCKHSGRKFEEIHTLLDAFLSDSFGPRISERLGVAR